MQLFNADNFNCDLEQLTRIKYTWTTSTNPTESRINVCLLSKHTELQNGTLQLWNL